MENIAGLMPFAAYKVNFSVKCEIESMTDWSWWYLSTVLSHRKQADRFYCRGYYSMWNQGTRPDMFLPFHYLALTHARSCRE